MYSIIDYENSVTGDDSIFYLFIYMLKYVLTVMRYLIGQIIWSFPVHGRFESFRDDGGTPVLRIPTERMSTFCMLRCY